MTPGETGTVPRPGAGPTAKRAAQVADRIVADVTASGWPVGQVLGSEADLLARYQVSRAVFREAVRLVEHQQVARTRRGPGGGLVVTEPTMAAVTDAVVQYLQQVAARLDDVFEARVVLEEIACNLAATRAPGPPAGEPGEFHAWVAASSGNACLELFAEVLEAVTLYYSSERARSASTPERDAEHEHAAIAAAIVARDGALAGDRMRRHLEVQAEHVRRRRSVRQLLPDSLGPRQSDPEKGAEVVARSLNRSIQSARLQPGQLVGTERELMDREGVSRAVLREAVRLLEHQQAARMRRGPGGGLFVVAPGPDAVTDMACIYLARRGVPSADVAACRGAVEGAAAAMAAERRDDEGAGGVEHALAWGAHAADADWERAAADFHVAVAAATRNKVLHLVILVLIRCSRRQRPDGSAPRAPRRVRAEAVVAHQDIARAIADGQADVARERMRRHLGTAGAV